MEERLKLRSLELVRGIAALSIVLVHTATQITFHPISQIKDFHNGLVFPPVPGVEVFFVVSGFLMMLAHADDFGRRDRIPRFLWNRAVRIYPIYWLVMLDLFRRLCLPDWHSFHAPSFDAWSYVSWCTLVPTWDMDLLPVAWTLRFEVAFYLMFALCLLPRAGLWIMTAWLAGTVLMAMVHTGHIAGPLSHVLDPFTFDFFAGVGAGYVFRRRSLSPGVAGLVAGFGVLLVLGRLPIDDWGYEAGPATARIVYGLGYGAILLGVSTLERSGKFRLGRWATILGLLSYPVYMTHPATLDYGIRWMAAANLPARFGVDAEFAALVGMSVAVGLAMAVFVDQPLQRWLRWSRSVGRKPSEILIST